MMYGYNKSQAVWDSLHGINHNVNQYGVEYPRHKNKEQERFDNGNIKQFTDQTDQKVFNDNKAIVEFWRSWINIL